MNDRLEIASRLLADYPTDSLETHIPHALHIADKLISLEIETRPKSDIKWEKSFNTAACHVKVGQFIQVGEEWLEVVNTDIGEDGYIWIYYHNGKYDSYSRNEEVTIKSSL